MALTQLGSPAVESEIQAGFVATHFSAVYRPARPHGGWKPTQSTSRPHPQGYISQAAEIKRATSVTRRAWVTPRAVGLQMSPMMRFSESRAFE